MARYERLSVIDRTFLDIESANYPQHVGVTMLFEAGPLQRSRGGIDAARIRAYIESRLHHVPRYRQKLAWIPIENHPIWVDDPSFRIDYHVRHTALPKPGDERQLKRLAARIMSQRLDRGRPLWEMFIVEGLRDNRFALITKTHHCMIDGIAGVDLMAVVLSPAPDEEIGEPIEWIPEPPPRFFELARSELFRRAAMPARAMWNIGEVLREPRRVADQIWEQVAAVGQTAATALSPASDTPLNRAVGPHRRFDWTAFELERVKEVKNRLGGTVNDVVLATVAGALGTFLERRGITRHRQRNMLLRAMVPVSMRPPIDRGTTGNQIALWAATLPVAETNPRRRLAAVREMTDNLKHSKQVLGASVLAAVSEWTVPTLLSSATRMAYRARAANLVVTNVPGPQIPLYLLGAPMVATYPMLNLLTKQSLGVAMFSYAGHLFWGFMADWDLVPDLHDFLRAVETSFQELCEEAEVARPVAIPLSREPRQVHREADTRA